jgi:hypothetical protein
MIDLTRRRRTEHVFLLALDQQLGKVNAFFATQQTLLSDQLEATVRSLYGGCSDASERATAIALLSALRRELGELRKFVDLNYVSTLKIIKKCNKVLQLSPIIAAHIILLRQPFYTSVQISQMLTRVDVLVGQLRAAGDDVGNLVDRNDFTCSICLELLSSPVVLSCTHRFCSSCIRRHLAVAEATDAAARAQTTARSAGSSGTGGDGTSRSSSSSSSALPMSIGANLSESTGSATSGSGGGARSIADKPLLNTTQVLDVLRHATPAASCPICRRAIDSMNVEIDTILERFIVASFGAEAAQAEKQSDESEPLHRALPPLFAPPATPALTHVGAYALGDALGRGRYARVYIGQRSLASQPHAIKVFQAALAARTGGAATPMTPTNSTVDSKLAAPAHAVQLQAAHRLAIDSERNARAEIAVLSAVASQRCAHLPRLVDVVWCAAAAATSSSSSSTTTANAAASGTSGTPSSPDGSTGASRLLLPAHEAISRFGARSASPAPMAIDGIASPPPGARAHTADEARDSDDDEDDASSDVDDEEDVSGAHEHDQVLAIVLPLYSGGDLVRV